MHPRIQILSIIVNSTENIPSRHQFFRDKKALQKSYPYLAKILFCKFKRIFPCYITWCVAMEQYDLHVCPTSCRRYDGQSPDMEKLQRSDVHLSGGLSSLGNLGCPIKGSPKNPRTSQHYDTEGFQGDPQLGQHFADINFRQSVTDSSIAKYCVSTGGIFLCRYRQS